MARVVLFDIDGTMLHAGGASRASFLRALNETLGALPSDFAPDLRGRTDPLILELAAQATLGRPPTPLEHAQFNERFVEHFKGEIERSIGFRVLPGVAELVRALASHDEAYLGVQTGNLESTARLKLRRAGLESYFEFGGYASDHPERASFMRTALERACTLHGEQFSPSEVVVLGDTVFDIQAAKANEFRVIAVATGGIPHQDLAAAGADFVLDDLSDSERVLSCIWG
jgi:phosphoglycolate phosphatase